MADALTIILTGSLILNFLFLAGTPIALFVRFLIKRTRWWFIGVGAQGVDIRQGKPVAGVYIWKTAKGPADVHLDAKLNKQTPDGRAVAFVDLDMMQHIAPKDEAGKPRRLLPQLAPYDGECENDDDVVVFRNRNGEIVGAVQRLWMRLDGWRHNQFRRRRVVRQQNEEEPGPWGVLEKAMPALMILAVVLLFVVLIMLGGLL